MKSIGLLIALIGTVLSVIYPPFENGSWSGYGFIWSSFDTWFGVMQVWDWVNVQQLFMQLLVINIIGLGLAILGAIQEKAQN